MRPYITLDLATEMSFIFWNIFSDYREAKLSILLVEKFSKRRFFWRKAKY